MKEKDAVYPEKTDECRYHLKCSNENSNVFAEYLENVAFDPNSNLLETLKRT